MTTINHLLWWASVACSSNLKGRALCSKKCAVVNKSLKPDIQSCWKRKGGAGKHPVRRRWELKVNGVQFYLPVPLCHHIWREEGQVGQSHVFRVSDDQTIVDSSSTKVELLASACCVSWRNHLVQGKWRWLWWEWVQRPWEWPRPAGKLFSQGCERYGKGCE